MSTSTVAKRPQPMSRQEPVARLDPAIPRASQGQGTVLSKVDDSGWMVETAFGPIVMQRAASCLLVAEVGDLVWWCCDATAETPQAWILAVLTRHAPEATLELPPSTIIRGRQAVVVLETAEFVGGCWQAVVGTLRYTGQALACVLDRITTTARRHERFTEDDDVVHAGRIELRARQLAQVQAEHVLVQGERLVKTRGAQIHMG